MLLVDSVRTLALVGFEGLDGVPGLLQCAGLDQHTPASTKLRAADLVLTHGAKAIEIEDIEARVAELERAAEESKQTR